MIEHRSGRAKAVLFIALGLTSLSLWLWFREPPGKSLEAANALHHKGKRLVNRGEFEKALPKLWEAYRIRRATLGLSNSHTRATMTLLDKALSQRGDWTNALELIADFEQVEYEERLKQFAEESTGAATNHSDWRSRISPEQMRHLAPPPPRPRETVERVSNMLAYVTKMANSPGERTMAAAHATSREIEKELLGYSDEQLREQKRLDEAVELWEKRNAGKSGAERLSDEVMKTMPTAPGLGITVSLIPTNRPRPGVDEENLRRRVRAVLATRNPADYKAVVNQHFYGKKRQAVDEIWFREELEADHGEFERGVPLIALLVHKATYGTTTDLPAETEAFPRLTALVALNLKGLFLEREFRLQTALAGTKIPWVVAAIRKSREAEVAARQTESNHSSRSTKNGNAIGARLKVESNAVLELRKEQARVRALGLALPKAGRGEIITPEAITSKLPSNHVLVEFLNYGRDSGGTNLIESRYGAVMIPWRGEPKWIPLPTAREIAEMVNRCVNILRRSEPQHNGPHRFRQWDAELKAALTDVSTRVWKPIAAAFPAGTRTIFLAPDGDLHRLPFAALLDGDSFVSDRFEIRYLLGGRDLLSVEPLTESATLEIWADPDFDAVILGAAQTATGWRVGDLYFDSMTEGQQDLDLLTRLATSRAGLSPRPHRDKEASESALASVNRPLVFHLATHGVYVPLRPAPIPDDPHANYGARLVEPLYRCALALAGANRAINSWGLDTAKPPAIDGLLLPVEAAQLNLRGTWLATLAACDTGVGGASEGEGFFCLKLGFLQAGAQNVLFTLWPIDKKYTPVFLRAFYEEALNSGDPGGALARVQVKQLNKLSSLPHATSLWERVRYAAPYAVISRGHANPPAILTRR